MSSQSLAAQRSDDDYDVIVIGGGFAGVTAARDSVENGSRTLMLEARNRLGGRTFYAEIDGHFIEQGGAWIHWSQPNVWAEKERYSLEVIETPGFNPDVMITSVGGEPRQMGEEDVYAVMQAFQAYTADARAVWERPYDSDHSWDLIVEADKMTAAEKLDSLGLTDFQQGILSGLIASCAHNTTDNMAFPEALRWMSCGGYNDFLAFLDAVGRYKFKHGTISLINAMIEDGKPEIRLSTVVSRVEDLDDKVRVTTEEGKVYYASAVISTLPMNVLPSVEFSPDLHPKVKEAAKERHTGSGVKLYARTKKPVGKVLMFGDQHDPIASAWTYKEEKDHTLIVCFNNDAGKLDMYDEEEVQAALARFIPDIEIDSVFGYDWNLDPYALGTYASYKPGWMDKYVEHFQKDMGRILMASGDHGEGWRGFIDGAIREGAKAAQRVKQFVG